jgi:hypothetical protein
MPDDDFVALDRAPGLAGPEVREKLSDVTRSQMLEAELCLMAAERLEPPGAILN